MNKIIKLGMGLIAILVISACGEKTEEPKDDVIVEHITTKQKLFEEVIDILDEQLGEQWTEEELYYQAMLGLLDQIDDPFARYLSEEEFELRYGALSGSTVGIGARLGFIDEKFVVLEIVEDGAADQVGIRSGDIIIEVNGVKVTDDNVEALRNSLFGEAGTMVSLKIERSGQSEWMFFELVRKETDVLSLDYQLIAREDRKIGYINIYLFELNTPTYFAEALSNLEAEGIDGLIVDVRDNPGGYDVSVNEILQQLLVENNTPVMTSEYDDGETKMVYGGLEQPKPYEIVTLINEDSASASEVFAASMKEHGHYELIGETTYGKGTMQSFFPIETYQGNRLVITSGRWLTPLNKAIEGEGVTPSIEVVPTKLEEATFIYLSYEEEYFFDSVDERVENLQVILNGMGYTLRTDGYYDLDTKLAIEDIQFKHDLEITGNVNQETAMIINAFLRTFQDDLDNDSQLVEAIDYLMTN